MIQTKETKQPANAVQSYKSGLVKTQETFINMLMKTGQEMALQYDTYQISCARNMLSKMVELLWKEGLTINQINQNNITDILQTVAMMRLNPSASPREVYVILRSVKIGSEWQKVFEMGIEGDGNDKLLREYGVDIKKVHNCWIVREGDDFTYPSFNGLSINPPTWAPKGYANKVLRVVYPIEMMDGSVEYHIAERESVAINLQAHISNNLMKNKDLGDKKKQEILDRIAKLKLKEILEDKEVMEIASPAWRSAHSREAMIIRKLRNNCIKKIPKDFRNSFVEKEYEKTFEDYDQYDGSFSNHPDVDPEKVVDTEYEELAGKEEIKVELINEFDEETGEIVEQVSNNIMDDTKGKKPKPF